MNSGKRFKTFLIGSIIATLPLTTATAAVRASSALPTASAAPLAGAQVGDANDDDDDDRFPILPLIGIAVTIGVAIWIILEDDDDEADSRA